MDFSSELEQDHVQKIRSRVRSRLKSRVKKV